MSHDDCFALLIAKLGWRMESSGFGRGSTNHLVYPGSGYIGLGMRTDVIVAMRELGWLNDPSLVEDSDGNVEFSRAEYEVRFLLRLWDYMPLPQLVSLLRMGVTEPMVEAHIEHNVDIELLLTL